MRVNINRRKIACLILCSLVSFSAAILAENVVAAAEDDSKPFAEKKIVLQISDSEPAKQELILNVTNNLLKEYGADKVEIEIVAFGPGLTLLFEDNANKERLQNISTAGVKLTACSNTIKGMSKKLGHPVKINPLADTTLPGIVRIVKLVTEDGYTLVRP
jgi:hypothetical protein